MRIAAALMFAAGLLMIVAIILGAMPASAQMGSATIEIYKGQCLKRDAMVRLLRSAYYESVVGAGVVSGGAAVVEVWQNKDAGTFTVTHYDGEDSCIVFAGEFWTPIAAKVVRPGEYM